MAARTKILMGLTLITALLAAVATVLLGLISPAQAEGALPVVSGGGVNGIGLIAAALATGLSSLGAAYAVAHVGVAAIGAITEKPELFGRVLILIGLAEGIAIYGVIISILILNKLA